MKRIFAVILAMVLAVMLGLPLSARANTVVAVPEMQSFGDLFAGIPLKESVREDIRIVEDVCEDVETVKEYESARKYVENQDDNSVKAELADEAETEEDIEDHDCMHFIFVDIEDLGDGYFIGTCECGEKINYYECDDSEMDEVECEIPEEEDILDEE